MQVLPVIHILNKQQTIAQAELLVSSKCDGFWLINHGGDDDLTLSLAVTLSERYPDFVVGVNLLSHSADSAINATVEHGLKYLWLDYAGVHSVYPNETLLTQLKDIGLQHNVQIFAGAAFKYQSPEPDPANAASLAQAHGFIVTTSGSGTGHAADLTKIKYMSCAVDCQLAIASGLTIDNLTDYYPYVEYALIATGISHDEYYFDPKKLTEFMNKAHELNSKKSDFDCREINV
jgi:predicted TIM-barrel enzyme